MLRLVLVTLLVFPGIHAAAPHRTCSSLSNDRFAIDGSPSVLSFAFIGQAAYLIFDSGKIDPFLQFMPVARTSRGCGSSDPGIVSLPPNTVLGSQRVVSGDFNNDGIPDAAAVNVAPGRVSVFLGDSTGALKPATSYAVGLTPQSVVVADLNNDGILDLAVTDSGSGSTNPGAVNILLGRGDGAFNPPFKVPVSTGPFGLTVADIDGDGIPDLVAVNERSGSVSTLLGIGDGTFQLQREDFVGQGPTSVVAADFNGDGLLDLAIINTIGSSLSILPGNGDGTYNPATTYPIGDGPGYIAVADFNGDGKPDVAILLDSSNTLSIRLGLGDGGFGPAANYVVGTRPASIGLADLDGDGVIDILAPDPTSRSILILWGRPDGTFDAPPMYAVGLAPAAILVADLNGDGIADLVTPNLASSDISILLGGSNAGFRLIQSIFLGNPDEATDPRPAGIAAGDFNGDGIPDLAVSTGLPQNQVAILIGKGDGTFRIGGKFRTGADPHAVLVADFDGDGNLDIATANTNRFSNTDFGDLTVLLGNGDGTFRAPVSYDAGARPNSVVAGDFNGDGIVDLAVGASGDLRAQQLEAVSVLLGNGDGTFQPPIYVVVGEGLPATGTISSLAVGDFDGDGKPDLVVTASSTIEILIGVGDGTFQRASYPTGAGARFVATADLDGDGKLDVVITHCCASTDMSFMLGNGDGTFQKEADFPGGASPTASAVGDFNADGRPDLAIAAGLQKGSVAILLNRK